MKDLMERGLRVLATKKRSKGREGKIRSGIDGTSTLWMITRANYADIPGIVYDYISINKSQEIEGVERDLLKHDLNQLRKLKVTSEQIKKEFEVFLGYVMDEIKKDFKLKKSQLFDENGFILVEPKTIEKINACYIRNKLLKFYQVREEIPCNELKAISRDEVEYSEL